ncbi:MAG: SigB/SigF/SigG family RNA polymerase sigma factor [Ilumatobacteraceae bacterium]
MNPDTASSDADDKWLTKSLVQYSKTRDKTLRNEIALRTNWIALRSARRFWDRGEPFDDLVQVANVGLLKAIDRFDPTQGVHFGAFATPTIIGELRRHFRDYTWSVHVPRRTKDMRTSINAARDDLTKTLGRSPRVAEIATRLNVSADMVIGVLEANNAYRAYSIDRTEFDAPSTSEPRFDDVLDRQVVAELLDQLPPRQRKIIYLRFFEELSQEQIAEQIGTSQVHVGRLIASSLAELRRQIGDV